MLFVLVPFFGNPLFDGIKFSPVRHVCFQELIEPNRKKRERGCSERIFSLFHLPNRLGSALANHPFIITQTELNGSILFLIELSIIDQLVPFVSKG